MEALLLTDQRVDRTKTGLFAPGNKIHELNNDRGKGYAKPTNRLASILGSRSGKEIRERIAAADFESENGLDIVVYKRAALAIDGDEHATDFVFDRLEGKAPQTMKQEITGANGGPVAVVTADVTNLLLELSQKASGD